MASKIDKFEKDILKEIQFLTEEAAIIKQQKLSEGFLDKLFGMLAQKPLTRALGKAIKIANKDPQVKAKLIDYLNTRDQTLDMMATYCDKNPDSPLCYGKFAKTYGFDFNPKRKKGERSRYQKRGKHIRA